MGMYLPGESGPPEWMKKTTSVFPDVGAKGRLRASKRPFRVVGAAPAAMNIEIQFTDSQSEPFWIGMADWVDAVEPE